MAKKQSSIEQQLGRLEAIRSELERAEHPIEELIKLYEEGMRIAQRLRRDLQQLRQRIITLSQQTAQSKEMQRDTDRNADEIDSEDLFDD